MKHLKNFNESEESKDIAITMADVRNLKHNLGYRRKDVDDKDSFLKNYSWTEDQILIATPGFKKPDTWDGKKVEIYDLYRKSDNEKYKYGGEIGYAILVDGKVEYLIGIYEPHGCSLNAKRGLVTAHGHEQIIKLWLDDGEFEETYTR